MKNKTCTTCKYNGFNLFVQPCCDCRISEDGVFSGWEQKLDPITPEKFKNAMDELATSSSLIGIDRHKYMNALMCELLRGLGYDDGIDIFEATRKWYT